jgi:light-regulated signal transduction histidine kinase (bacteriophytochrome)
MSTATSNERYDIDYLQAALEAETQFRLESEDRIRRGQEEFQAFVLNAVHDLREPLRAINIYCELLARKEQNSSDAEGEQFRRHILEGTARIQTLMEGIVEYAAAGTDNQYLLSVDMHEVFRGAEAAVRPEPRQRDVVVAVGSLPVVKGDFGKLEKVARHLVDNAARYCDKPQAQIHVSARREDSNWLVLVRDNGPGIDASYHQRIFEPFKRLHGRQYRGHGLGLAFCRRAIESHGGRIWVESRLGEGSTFCFTLPAAD